MEERLPIPKEILIRALLTVEESENRALIKMAGDLPKLTEDEKEANLQKLLTQIKNTPAPVKKKKAVVVRSKRKIITYIIVAAILMSLICMSVTAIREPICNFFVDIFERFTAVVVYEPANEANDINKIKAFEYIPDGYKLESEFSGSKMERYIWNDGTNKIRLTHYLAGKNTDYILNTEDSAIQQIIINDINALYYIVDDWQVIIWNANGEVFMLDFAIDVSITELEKMIENIIFEAK